MAAATHWSIVKLLVDHVGIVPLQANVWGWLIAFSVSYTGHQRLTFAAQRAPMRSSLPRFFLVSLGGFLINEATYALLLRLGGWRYDVTLGVVLVGVAVATFAAGRLWAFKHHAA